MEPNQASLFLLDGVKVLKYYSCRQMYLYPQYISASCRSKTFAGRYLSSYLYHCDTYLHRQAILITCRGSWTILHSSLVRLSIYPSSFAQQFFCDSGSIVISIAPSVLVELIKDGETKNSVLKYATSLLRVRSRWGQSRMTERDKEL